MKNATIELITEKTRFTAGAPQTAEVLIRVTPPEIDKPQERPKMNISLVLDRSGSMGGAKIEQARHAASHCVDQLLPHDRMSLVIFDDEVETLIPSAPAGNAELYKRLIAQIQTRGSTALHEAWVKGGIEVSEHLDEGRVNRVILITDGQANVGETRTQTIVEQTAELARRGVSTSTIGIGADFNEELLVPMADAGEGNAWHVEEAADMVRIFESELGGALAQTGRSVTMRITPRDGVRIADVMNDFKRGDSGEYLLPNMIAGRPLEIVVAVAVPAASAGDRLALFDVAIEYTDQQTSRLRTVEAVLTAEFDTAEAVGALPENADVRKASVLLANARARAEAIREMDRGNYDIARDHVRSAAVSAHALYIRTQSPDLAEEALKLEAELNELDSRDLDIMTRKKLMYAAHQRRRGR